jgi:hypothetical protein
MIDHLLYKKIQDGIPGCSDNRLLEIADLVIDEMDKRKSEHDNIKKLVEQLSKLESDW